MHRKTTLMLGAALIITAPWATGQTVYRCGSSYSQQPCAGGSAIPLAPAPAAGDAAKAAAAAQADARRADAMEKARLAQEKNAPRAIVIASPQPQASPVADRRAMAPKAGKLEQFTAVAPKRPGEGKKNSATKKPGEAKKTIKPKA